MEKKFKKVFEQITKLDYDRDDGIFIMLHEWDFKAPTETLSEIKKFDGRKIRITVETVD